jgi:hypothetical protein
VYSIGVEDEESWGGDSLVEASYSWGGSIEDAEDSRNTKKGATNCQYIQQLELSAIITPAKAVEAADKGVTSWVTRISCKKEVIIVNGDIIRKDSIKLKIKIMWKRG